MRRLLYFIVIVVCIVFSSLSIISFYSSFTKYVMDDTVNETQPNTITISYDKPDKEIGDPPRGANFEVYQIMRGDTLTGISEWTGISVDKLATYNSIQNKNLIYANSSLRVPID